MKVSVVAMASAALVAPVILAEEPASLDLTTSHDQLLRGTRRLAGEQSCRVMNWYNWNDFKYACQWNHGSKGYNLFFQRYSGSIVWECYCDNHLGSYDPWNLNVWTWSKTDGVACYTRDGKRYDQVMHNFDRVSCDQRFLKNCDEDKGQCTYFDHGGGGGGGGGGCKKPPCGNGLVSDLEGK